MAPPTQPAQAVTQQHPGFLYQARRLAAWSMVSSRAFAGSVLIIALMKTSTWAIPQFRKTGAGAARSG